MSFMFRTAVRTETSLLIGIAGASGSGKTFSAMRLASGLSGDKPFAVIDTESGRALHYADQFKFDHGELRAPFTPQAYTDAFQAADQAGYPAIIIDSLSHEYESEGGILEWADRLAASMKPPKNWTEPKTAHKRMVGKLLQCRAHIIFCMRAEDKIRITKDANGKMVIIQPEQIPLADRWIPICEKRFPYELTISMIMTPDRPGVPVPIKIQEQHRFAFPEGQRVDEEAGRKLGAWARGQQNGGGQSSPLAAASVDHLKEQAEEASSGGLDVLETWFKGLGKEDRLTIKPFLDGYKAKAAEAEREADARAGAET